MIRFKLKQWFYNISTMNKLSRIKCIKSLYGKKHIDLMTSRVYAVSLSVLLSALVTNDVELGDKVRHSAIQKGNMLVLL